MEKQAQIDHVEGTDMLYCPDLYCNKKAPVGTPPTCDKCGEWSCPNHAPECCEKGGAIQQVRWELLDNGFPISATTPHELLEELVVMELDCLLAFLESQYYNAVVDAFDMYDELGARWDMLRRTIFPSMRN